MLETNSKVVLLGEAGVGKTCIISRYINNTFDEKSLATNGASYACKAVYYEDISKNLKLDIWDTAGQEKYRSLTKFFYKDAKIAILVYDITRKKSFDELKSYWYEQLKAIGEKNTIVGIAGNKCDLFDKEAVSESEGKEFADSIKAIFKLTSASTNVGIEELFKAVGRKFLEPDYSPSVDKGKAVREKGNEKPNEENIVLNRKNTKDKKKKNNC